MGKRLYVNPTGFAKWAREASGSYEGFIKRLMTLAKREQFTPEEFGSVFGAVPYAMGQKWTIETFNELGISPETRLASFRGFAGGISQNIYGGPKRQAAGTLGSLEPRAFEILKAGHYGQLGEEISADLASRLAVTNADKISSYESLTKSLQSLTGELKPSKTDTLEKGSFWLRTGKGSDVFIPGAEDIRRMTSFKATSGDVFKGMPFAGLRCDSRIVKIFRDGSFRSRNIDLICCFARSSSMPLSTA